MSEEKKVKEISNKYGLPEDLLGYVNKRISYEKKTQERLQELANKDKLNVMDYQKAVGEMIATSGLPQEYIIDWVKQCKSMGMDKEVIRNIAKLGDGKNVQLGRDKKSD